MRRYFGKKKQTNKTFTDFISERKEPPKRSKLVDLKVLIQENEKKNFPNLPRNVLFSSVYLGIEIFLINFKKLLFDLMLIEWDLILSLFHFFSLHVCHCVSE